MRKGTLVDLPLEEVIVEGRHRRNYAEVEALAQTITEVGLLHPIVVTPQKRLLAGGRRLKACRLLGWTTLPAYIAQTPEDALSLLRAEAVENASRTRMLPSEAVSLAEALLPLEEEEARKRMLHQTEKASEKFSQVGRAIDKVAEMAQMSRPTLTKAMRITVAAREDPDQYGDLVEEMDVRGKINGVYLELRRRKGETSERVRGSVSFRLDKDGTFQPPKTLDRQDLLALKTLLQRIEAEMED
jgi:ParB-like chromosome segregation protein Spo0J